MKQHNDGNVQRSPNLITAVGFRILTCHLNEEDDSAVFSDTPLIGWLQTNAPLGGPVDPIFLLDGFGGPMLGSELAAYNVAYRVIHSELHDGQRFRLKGQLEREMRSMEADPHNKMK